MKIISGISNVHTLEEIEKYVQAGVDEFFIGYVPQEWSNVYGFEISCNRREHSKYQYHTLSELENVVRCIHDSGRKVFLTFNAHEYNYQQYILVQKILKSIDHIPFDAFILSNIGLMLELRSAGFSKPFNLSIGAGNSTVEALKFYLNNIDNIYRFILPRKFTVSELEEITGFAREKSIRLEAFLLGDPCHFSDEYCFTWHGAKNLSLCNSPMYLNKKINPLGFDENWKESIFSEPLSKYYETYATILNRVEHRHSQNTANKQTKATGKEEFKKLHILNRMSKCGLCMIQKFKEWGLDAVKLPLRGYSIDTNLQVIGLVRKIIETQNATPQICRQLLNSPSFCSGDNCYYNYPYQK
ncbi:MAG: U32 family peptidase [Bacteroidales bacterium]|nr:U32 family peptidase [Bacteroidales bacterium]